MSLKIFSFAHQPSGIPVTVQHFHPSQLSSAAGGSPNLIPPSDSNAPSRLRGGVEDSHRALEDILFENRAELKILTSKVAMHLTESARSDLFRQIDQLLNMEDWTEDDQTIDIQSFRTFLRFMIYYCGVQRPSLTVTTGGNMSASWFSVSRRLTIEFLDQDRVRLVMYRLLDEEQDAETVAYQGPIRRIGAVVAGFGQIPWDRDGST